MALTGAVSWRGESIKYRKNEIFIDVIETQSVLVRMRGGRIRGGEWGEEEVEEEEKGKEKGEERR